MTAAMFVDGWWLHFGDGYSLVLVAILVITAIR